MANIELDGTNKKIKVDSGDLTLDVPGDIILDADGADLTFADGGTNILKITNSSSDVVFQNQVDAKDIIFKQYDGTEVAKIDDDGSFKVANSTLSISQSSSDVIIKPLTDAKDIFFQQYDGRTLLDINDGGYVAIANGATGPGQLRLYEDTDNGTNYTALQVGTQSGDITYTLPTADGSNGHALTTNGSGTLSWASAGTTYAGIDDQSSSNDDQITIADGEVTINEDSDDLDFRVESNGNTHMLFVDGGNNEVGINTSAAAATLHVQEATTNGTSALFVTATNSGIDGGTGTIRLRNTDNRTTNRGPYIGFDVSTSTGSDGAIEDGTVLAVIAPNSTNGDRKQDMVVRTRNSGTAEHFRIANDGTLTATDTSIGSNSDSRLKDNIQDYSYDISKFKSFKPRTFTWKNPQFHNAKFDASDNQIPTRGFVAQELNSVDDYWTDTLAVNDTDKSDYDLIPANSDGDHVAFTAKLGKKDSMYISIIQQLITKIETLETKVAALEG